MLKRLAGPQCTIALGILADWGSAEVNLQLRGTASPRLNPEGSVGQGSARLLALHELLVSCPLAASQGCHADTAVPCSVSVVLELEGSDRQLGQYARV